MGETKGAGRKSSDRSSPSPFMWRKGEGSAARGHSWFLTEEARTQTRSSHLCAITTAQHCLPSPQAWHPPHAPLTQGRVHALTHPYALRHSTWDLAASPGGRLRWPPCSWLEELASCDRSDLSESAVSLPTQEPNSDSRRKNALRLSGALRIRDDIISIVWVGNLCGEKERAFILLLTWCEETEGT
ncbi:hypothetical protein AAFF_G00395920 [Aldrovandia affinis]|uniref:Uncharacterized protein n=1 Tax=Aldrovandia affinis TaxID=143900 RepID=A0AAD7WKR5_9TELE|nr:hypothetical protein AAFF_G00395920 [Aldrovandia affinis]